MGTTVVRRRRNCCGGQRFVMPCETRRSVMNGRICTTLAVGLFLAELDGPVEVAGASCEGVSFHIQQLNASDAATGDHFGWALAMQDATLLVASPEADSPSPTLGTGAAYVFQLNGTAWSQAARLTASDRA